MVPWSLLADISRGGERCAGEGSAPDPWMGPAPTEARLKPTCACQSPEAENGAGGSGLSPAC